MVPEESRRRMIEILEGYAAKLQEFTAKCRQDRIARGWDLENDITLGYTEMMSGLLKGWLSSERELLELENGFREFSREKMRRTRSIEVKRRSRRK